MKTDFLLLDNSEPFLNRLKYFISNNLNTSFILCIGIAFIGGFFAFPLSFLTKSNALIGFALFPFVLSINQKQRVNYYYLATLVFFMTLTYAYHIRVFYFFTLAFFVLFATELWIGKVNTLVVFLLAFMSPIFEQVTIILGFPIRLQISKIAGYILANTGMSIQVEGNMMMLNGASFAVDDACMGLNMLAISMLMGVMALAHQYYTRKVNLSILKTVFFFVFVFLLNLIGNLLRILILVKFNILPENPMHEIVGILCFVVYIMIPIFFLSKWITFRFGESILSDQGGIQITKFGKSFLLIFSIAIMLIGIHLNKSRTQLSSVYATSSLRGFQSVDLKDGITKFTSDKALVYVKPIPEFFTGEHTPLFCWKGSGYHFESIRTTKIHGEEIYVGHLVNEKSRLYTAWWYSNGKVQTINQFDWRFRMINGENKFCLVNVTSSTEADLNAMLSLILKEKQLLLSSN